MSEGLSNKTINEYFMLTLYEIEQGTLYREIELMLKEYEEREMYLACAGIIKAIEYSKFNSLVSITRELYPEKQLNKIQFIQDEKRDNTRD
jgi:hypothetical protein